MGVKIRLDLLKGLWSYGGFKLREPGYPQIFSAPSSDTMRQTPKVFEVRERARGPLSPCQFDGARISSAAGVAKNVEFFVCLSVCLFVCLSVTLLSVRVCAPNFAMKALEYRNDLDTVV